MTPGPAQQLLPHLLLVTPTGSGTSQMTKVCSTCAKVLYICVLFAMACNIECANVCYKNTVYPQVVTQITRHKRERMPPQRWTTISTMTKIM